MALGQIFVSYSHLDKIDALSIYDHLKMAGFNVWIDTYCIRPGQPWDRTIQKNLASSDTLLLIHTQNSFNSGNVWDEWSYFVNRGKVVIPLKFDNSDVPFRLERLQYIDFIDDPFEYGLDTLISVLIALHPDPDPTVDNDEELVRHSDKRISRLSGHRQEQAWSNDDLARDSQQVEYIGRLMAEPVPDNHPTNLMQDNHGDSQLDVPYTRQHDTVSFADTTVTPERLREETPRDDIRPSYLVDNDGNVWEWNTLIDIEPVGQAEDNFNSSIMDEAVQIIDCAFQRTSHDNERSIAMRKQKL